MTTPCEYKGECESDCARHMDDCDGQLKALELSQVEVNWILYWLHEVEDYWSSLPDNEQNMLKCIIGKFREVRDEV